MEIAVTCLRHPYSKAPRPWSSSSLCPKWPRVKGVLIAEPGSDFCRRLPKRLKRMGRIGTGLDRAPHRLAGEFRLGTRSRLMDTDGYCSIRITRYPEVATGESL